MEKTLDVKVIHDDKYILSRINSFEEKVRTDSLDDGLSLEKNSCTIHLMILESEQYLMIQFIDVINAIILK